MRYTIWMLQSIRCLTNCWPETFFKREHQLLRLLWTLVIITRSLSIVYCTYNTISVMLRTDRYNRIGLLLGIIIYDFIPVLIKSFKWKKTDTFQLRRAKITWHYEFSSRLIGKQAWKCVHKCAFIESHHQHWNIEASERRSFEVHHSNKVG